MINLKFSKSPALVGLPYLTRLCNVLAISAKSPKNNFFHSHENLKSKEKRTISFHTQSWEFGKFQKIISCSF